MPPASNLSIAVDGERDRRGEARWVAVSWGRKEREEGRAKGERRERGSGRGKEGGSEQPHQETPDVACYAKLLTGGLVPMALTLASEVGKLS